jgi:hypothetical protein
MMSGVKDRVNMDVDKMKIMANLTTLKQMQENLHPKHNINQQFNS